jgi:hypothetical protein
MSSWLIAGIVVLGVGAVVSIFLFGLVVKDLRNPKAPK